MFTRITTAAASVLLLAGPATAQNGERYALERTENGYVRLDLETGRMSHCSERSGELVCRFAVEEGADDADTAAELAARIAALEDRVATLENRPAANEGLPSEQEFEKGLGYMERFMRRFFGVVREFDQDLGGEESPEPVPDRT